MKKVLLFTVLFLLITACKKELKNVGESVLDKYQSFGAEITTDGFISREKMITQFKTLKAGDTVDVKFASKVNSVCKVKGCWMRLDLGNEEESMMKFKDYSFFVPLNSENRKVIVKGKAYVTEVPVAEQQHFAKDAGESAEEIAKIINPKFTYSIIADGVLMESDNEVQ